MGAMAQGKIEVMKEVDAQGEICPYPLLMAQKAMKSVKPGERLLVKIDYAKSSEDIPRWAQDAGHKVIEIRKTADSQWEIILERAGG